MQIGKKKAGLAGFSKSALFEFDNFQIDQYQSHRS